ncbi:MAG: hypothetical protein LBS90_07250 [Oscillospiraceae bacterium]|jgi:hypothetical protein|nr:hypothetical protein [Oscillospiraceae bacterium]
MTELESFREKTRKGLFAALAEFQNGNMKCDGIRCEDCDFYSAYNPAGDRCEIVNVELKLCRLLKCMEKPKE